MWDWIQDRGDYRKEPSSAERFDTLLRAISGRSLKEVNHLWEGFRNLRQARNSFAHDGLAVIGNRQVDRQEAVRLVAMAREIIDWIDDLLPAAERRPKFASTVQTEVAIMMVEGGGLTLGAASAGEGMPEEVEQPVSRADDQ